jgi:serine/threonine protein kinase
MEYLEIGDLLTYLYHKPSLPENEVKEIAYQILDGLNMMHENGFSHRDLKPEVSSLISVEMRAFTKANG